MPKTIKYEGDGLTRRRIETEYRAPATPGEEMIAVMEEWVEASRDPWSANAGLFSEIMAKREKSRLLQPAVRDRDAWQEYYRPRESPAWYLRELARTISTVESNRAKGDWGWALYSAMNFGLLYAEAEIKFAWDPIVQPLLRAKERHLDAVTPGMTAAARAELVERVLRERQRGVVDACRIVAQRYPAAGAWRTIRDAYYATKKGVAR